MGLLPMCTQAVTFGLFANFTGTNPGSIYDLGTLASTDTIKVNLTWTLLAGFGRIPTVTVVPYTMSGGVGTSATINPGDITSPTPTNVIYEATTGQNAQFYIAI